MSDHCAHCGNEKAWVATGICASCFTFKHGGQAFPQMAVLGHKDYHPGLSKREWFAGIALQGMMAHDATGLAAAIREGTENGRKAITNTARLAFALADAMLRENCSGG